MFYSIPFKGKYNLYIYIYLYRKDSKNEIYIYIYYIIIHYASAYKKKKKIISAPTSTLYSFISLATSNPGKMERKRKEKKTHPDFTG